MREAERSVDQRVSILDRPATESDALPAHVLGGIAQEVDLPSVRLALVPDDLHAYVGLGTRAESLFLCLEGADSAGSGIGPRATLVTHGAIRQGHGSARGFVTIGIVADVVTAVRVGDVEAVLVNNVYVARAPMHDEVVVTTAAGERTVPKPRPAGRNRRAN